jgi:hypothetical protein
MPRLQQPPAARTVNGLSGARQIGEQPTGRRHFGTSRDAHPATPKDCGGHPLCRQGNFTGQTGNHGPRLTGLGRMGERRCDEVMNVGSPRKSLSEVRGAWPTPCPVVRHPLRREGRRRGRRRGHDHCWDPVGRDPLGTACHRNHSWRGQVNCQSGGAAGRCDPRRRAMSRPIAVLVGSLGMNNWVSCPFARWPSIHRRVPMADDVAIEIGTGRHHN